MRVRDLHDYWTLRRVAANPWPVLQFRKAQREGGELAVQLREAAPLYLRGRRHDYHVFTRVFLRDEYRLHTMAPDRLGCVVDLGANVGIFAARAAAVADRVIAYEPFPDNYAQLEKNVRDRPNVTAVCAAVAEREGTLRLFQPKDAQGSGLVSAFPDRAGFMSADSVDVPTHTLDGLFAAHGIDTCDLLKIDVEGAEYDILYAASPGTLARITRIHGEYHDVRPEDPRTRIGAFATYLNTQGFTVDLAPHKKHPNHGLFFASRRPAR